MHRSLPTVLPTTLPTVLVLISLATTAAVHAEPTPVTVRVISEGAKFVGSGVGGARVVLEDAATGAVLAQGLTRGGTGDTDHIMNTRHPRTAVLSRGGAAKFATELDLTAPTRVRARVTGPRAEGHAAAEVTATRWLLPGQGISSGDGWLLELPGLAVEILEPEPLVSATAGEAVPLTASVRLLCGCPIDPEAPWVPAHYDVGALVEHEGEQVADVTLEYAGETSRFRGSFVPESAGSHLITLYARDKRTDSTGIDRTTVRVRER